MKVFYNTEYVAPAHAFETTRKSSQVAEAVTAGRVQGAELADPQAIIDLCEELIAQVHDPDYIKALKTGEPSHLAESQGFDWDPGIWSMAVNSTAGVLAAAEVAVATGRPSGSLSSGLHHARYSNGSGYCTVNGLAVAARWATARVAGHVTILDTDAHCGGGTHQLLDDEERILHLDLSVNSFDCYEPVGDNELSILINPDETEYLAEVDRLLSRVPSDTELLIYNAGMDPYPTVTRACLAERERRVAQWCAEQKVPVVFVLAGGYLTALDMEGLVDLHLETPRAFADHDHQTAPADLETFSKTRPGGWDGRLMAPQTDMSFPTPTTIWIDDPAINQEDMDLLDEAGFHHETRSSLGSIAQSGPPDPRPSRRWSTTT